MRKPAEARLLLIRQRLCESASVSVSGLAAELGVSEMTIRRDLEKLEEEADVRRIHGGAVLADRMVFEFEYKERQRQNLRQKPRLRLRPASSFSPDKESFWTQAPPPCSLPCCSKKAQV